MKQIQKRKVAKSFKMDTRFCDLQPLCEWGEDRAPLLTALQDWGLILKENQYPCPKCGTQLKLGADNTRTAEPWRWYCPGMRVKNRRRKIRCGNRISFRTGTFFARSHLTLLQMLAFVDFWVAGMPLTFTSRQLQISYPAAVDWASFCREVVLNAMFDRREQIGGPGVTVEVDESKFGKRKYHRGHRVQGQWVFGGYERGTGRVFMVAAPDRGRETLVSVIREWILPGTTIVSDCWRASNLLNEIGYQHLTVNHSVTFRGLQTGSHTNSIEGSWRAAKAITSSAGRKKSHIPGNLAKYMFNKKCMELGLHRTREFFRLAGALYCPTRADPPQDDWESEEEEDTEFWKLVCALIGLAGASKPSDPKCSALNISLTQKIDNEGFHRQLNWLLERSPTSLQCKLALKLAIGKEMYVNPDEISDLNRLNLTDILIEGDVDVEVPAHLAEENTAYIFVPPLKERVSFTFPFHLRYQRAQISGGFGKVKVRKPEILAICPTRCGWNEVRAPCDSSNKVVCEWNDVSYQALYEDVEVMVPVGDLNDYPLVSIVTLLLGCAGCIYTLSVLSTTPL